MARTRDRLAKGAAKGAGRAALRDRRGSTGRTSVPREGTGRRYPGYGPLIVGGLLVLGGATMLVLLIRRGGRSDPATEPGGTDTAGPRAEGVYSGRPAAQPPGPAPEGGPGLRGDAHEPSAGGGGIEDRIRARVGEDPRTRDLLPLKVEVVDGMAWIDGNARSQEARTALTEVVGGVEGVNIVVNRVVVGGP